MATTHGAVSSDDVAAARKLIHDVISDTPVLHSRVLSEAVGGPVFLKAENLQRTGSFKVRGAYSLFGTLSAAEREAGVVAASAGNHGQAVACAAQILGWIKTKAADFSHRTGSASMIFGPNRLRCIFNERQSEALTKLEQRTNIRALSVHMDW